MRTISGQTLTLLAGKEQLEPAFILKVKWSNNGEFYYADRNIVTDSLNIPGKILNVASFDSTLQIDNGSQNSQVSITLDDTDGSLKNIIDRNDIHNRSAYLYQWFNGMPFEEMFLVASGMISTPIVWDEGKRSLSFDIVSRLESFEIGYSAEEGNFPSIALRLLGEPWPMVFGKVVHSPAMQLQDVPAAFTLSAFGTPDQTLQYEISRLELHASQCDKAASDAFFYAALACYRLRLDEDCDDDSETQSFNQQAVAFQEQAQQDRSESEHLQNIHAQQTSYPNSSALVPSTFINQPFVGLLRVGSQLFHGSITNQSGHVGGTPVLKRFVPTAATIDPDSPAPLPAQAQKEGFQFYQAGTSVAIASEYPIQWMVSMIPGTVQAVWAYRNVNGVRVLAKVPESYYTVKSLSYGSSIGAAVIIELSMPLSVRGFLEQLGIDTWENFYGAGLPQHVVNSVDWEEQIYVTFESSVGPNPVDIMTWVIAHYCPGLTYDETSFNTVRSYLTNYPMNFYYNQRPDAIKFLQDIAYQARCAIWIDTDTFYIKYLPVEEAAVDTITLDDIVVGSLQLTCTSTESLITKYVATWRPDYTPNYSDPVKLIQRFNIRNYGVHEESYDYFAYSAFTYVEKTATFWLIRKSMTWKLVKLKTFITKLALETFDTVTLDFSPFNLVANGTVKGIIQSAVYDPTDNTIEMLIWTPVRLGEMTAYDFAWPANASSSAFFPVYRDIQAGSGGGLNGTTGGNLPPSNSGQVLMQTIPPDRGGAGDQTLNNTPGLGIYAHTNGLGAVDGPNFNNIGVPTYGDPFPSDIGDIVASIEVRDPATPIPDVEPTFDYEYKDITDTKLDVPDLSLLTYPCRVEAKTGTDKGYQLYTVTAFPKGLTGKGLKIENVKQCQMDNDDQIPSGSFCHVVINAWTDKDNNKQREATIQIPVWLA